MNKLTIVIPCFNEEMTLELSVERVLEIADDNLSLEIIIVDDGSTDQSLRIAEELKAKYQEIELIKHGKNRGKGAALRAGFQQATGDFVAVQDADLEYNPKELKKLLDPLINGEADVVFGSRFLSTGAHRVLYFWHSLGNRFLTFLSNMFTDLNLTDIETCYKVFKRDVIQSVNIEEDRFGFEPEIVAKVAHKRVRIYEMGISYYGRTYGEGKKIGWRDGLRAIYCIFRYNAHQAPVPIQFLFYIFIGGFAAIINVIAFAAMHYSGVKVYVAAPIAFVSAAIVNYFLCIFLLFRHRIKWGLFTEQIIYWLLVGLVCMLDMIMTLLFFSIGIPAVIAKILASIIVLILNFSGRRFMVFPEPSSGPWLPQQASIVGKQKTGE